MEGNMPMYSGYGMGFGGGGFGILFMLLFWGLIIFGVIMFIRQFSKPASKSEEESAISIAAKRYAGGEISIEEFQRIKHNLK